MAKTDWRAFVALLPTLTEEQVKRMLDDEIKRYKRPAYVRRLHQRYSSLRTMRERGELMEQVTK